MGGGPILVQTAVSGADGAGVGAEGEWGGRKGGDLCDCCSSGDGFGGVGTCLGGSVWEMCVPAWPEGPEAVDSVCAGHVEAVWALVVVL